MEENHNFNSGTRLSSDYSFTYNILMLIIPYMDYEDLISCSEVCPIWNSIIKEAPFWNTYVMRICGNHLKEIMKKKELFFKKIELRRVDNYHVKDFVNILTSAENLEELELQECYFNFSDKLEKLLNKIRVLKITQFCSLDDNSNPYTTDFFNNLPNVTKLSITSTFRIRAMDKLMDVKHLFLDAKYSEELFKIDAKLLENLESFGIGFTNYNGYSEQINEYIKKFSVDMKQMKNLKKLQLYGLDTDFSILKTVSQFQHLESLELGLITAWNNYGSILATCDTIKKLCVKFYLPPNDMSHIEKIAIENSILFATVKELKNTLKEFTWIFDETYMKECEEVLAIKNNKWESNVTAIRSDISEFDPKNLSISDILKVTSKRAVCTLHLDNLEKMLIDELPDTKVRVVTKYSKTCEFCPPRSQEIVDLATLRRSRHDLLVPWIYNSIRKKRARIH